MRTASRQRAHRVTTANLGGIYPFHAGASLGPRGVYMGQDLLGNGAFCLDPWELYQARVISGWNMLILGTIGLGKSAWAKTWIGRQSVFGRRAWAIAPKPGEYDGLCEMLGVKPIRLEPGGRIRLNPLDARLAGPNADDARVLKLQRQLLYAIIEATLARTLSVEERSAVDEALGRAREETHDRPVVRDVARALFEPSDQSAGRLFATRRHVTRVGRDPALALRRMCEGDLEGMFDGPTSGSVNFDGPLVSLDLSAVWGSDALGVLMACAATAMQQAMLASPHTRWIAVTDEGWALLRNLGLARWQQECFKLSRALGAQFVLILHRFSDLEAVGDQSSEQAAIARGLLQDTAIQVIYGQHTAEVELSKRLLHLSDREASLIPYLAKGVALVRVGRRSYWVQHQLSDVEQAMVDTDQRAAA